MKNFEWDENKRELNLEKHGIDFVDAIEVFDDPDRIECSSHRKGEERVSNHRDDTRGCGLISLYDTEG